jgi:hypothetical protein
LTEVQSYLAEFRTSFGADFEGTAMKFLIPSTSASALALVLTGLGVFSAPSIAQAQEGQAFIQA